MSDKKIVIIGGGIIGCTTAYYLSDHPAFDGSIQITLLEASPTGVAQGASGKAGGLVAQWAYPRELVDVSYPEHIRLAEKHNGGDRWGWRFVNCGSWEGRGEDVGEKVGAGRGGKMNLGKTAGMEKGRGRRLPDDLSWIKEDLTTEYSPMAEEGKTAQVHPYLFTTSMLQLAQSKGVDFISGAKVTAINVDEQHKRVTGVTYQHSSGTTTTMSATHVVLSAGPWSPSLVPDLPISASRAHSIVIRPQPSAIISPYVLFTEIKMSRGYKIKKASPEIYARPNNEVYACGGAENVRLPGMVDDVEVDEKQCQSLHEQVSSISQELREGPVSQKQACFLPIVHTMEGPIVGEAVNVASGLVIAAGHTCWGICNAPATAKAVSELVLEGRIKCADLSRFEPGRFME